MVNVTDKKTGKDVYPEIEKRIKTLPSSFEPLTQEVFQIFAFCRFLEIATSVNIFLILIM
jgi:hypothetical protein